MIVDLITGEQWGTAAEIARELCLDPDAGEDLVRSWARPRAGRPARIRRRNVPGRGRGTTLYPLADAEAEELRARHARAGRPRGA